jgi:hypothetical protein
MALSTNNMHPVLEGPTVGRLMLATYGARDDDKLHDPKILTFVVRGERGQRHGVKFKITQVNPYLLRPLYDFKGLLEEMDGKVQAAPRQILKVEVDHYGPSSPRKGDAFLRINTHVAVDLEALFCLPAD